MQRGVVRLTSNQVQAILSFVSADDVSSLLLQKLRAVVDGQNQSQQLNLSQDEVEKLLDLLPAPTANEAVTLRQVRQQLQQFLFRLRS